MFSPGGSRARRSAKRLGFAHSFANDWTKDNGTKGFHPDFYAECIDGSGALAELKVMGPPLRPPERRGASEFSLQFGEPQLQYKVYKVYKV